MLQHPQKKLKLVSNWTVKSVNHTELLRTIKLHHKQMHISKLYSYINPLSSQSTKPAPTNVEQNIRTQTSNTNFQRVSPFNTTPAKTVKERIRLGHAGIADHSTLSTPEKRKRGEEKVRAGRTIAQ